MKKYEKPKLIKIDLELKDILLASTEIGFGGNNVFDDICVVERL